MRQMVDKGIEYLVLEATSQGIYQSRLWGITPEVVGFTNITPEHLDYHLTYDLYLEAKAELGKRATKKVIINADDELSVGKLRRILKDARVSVKDYSLQEKLPTVVEKAVRERFTQTYNWQNARLVYEMAKQVDVEDQDIAQSFRDFTGIPGRMESVAEYKDAEVLVDFAHTANGLFEALTTLRERMNKEKRQGQLVAVFGCAGLRDRSKRPIMGKTAAEIADVAIFTAEDPRTESVWGIIRQMKSQLAPHHNKVISIVDRGQAIAYALEHFATPGSIIGIFGKGHEQSMCFGTIEYPWNDKAAVLDTIHAHQHKHSPTTAQLKGRYGHQ
jgi:UDP-N-acetylmuramoyl-L-alanyl-D-glutamate--2,6-diaminopimelate ligase